VTVLQRAGVAGILSGVHFYPKKVVDLFSRRPCSAWGALGVLRGALTFFSCKLRLIFYPLWGAWGAGAPNAPLATPI